MSVPVVVSDAKENCQLRMKRRIFIGSRNVRLTPLPRGPSILFSGKGLFNHLREVECTHETYPYALAFAVTDGFAPG